MTKTRALLTLSLIALIPAIAQAQREYVYKVVSRGCSFAGHATAERSLTGFRVRNLPGIVTALHGVLGCTDIKLIGADNAIDFKQTYKIVKVDIKHDLALLSAPEIETLQPIGLETALNVDWKQIDAEKVWIIGFPVDYQGSQPDKVVIRRDGLFVPMNLLPEAVTVKLFQRGSPDPRQSFVNVASILLPGHSGAPLLDSQNRVIAVADGGLLGGVAGLNWAIPWQNISFVDVAGPATQQALETVANNDPQVLFSNGKNYLEEIERMGFNYNQATYFEQINRGDTAVVDLFIKAGIRVDEKRPDQKTGLMIATEKNDQNMMAIFIGNGAKVDAVGPGELTSLMFAARNGFDDAVKILLRAGANPNLKDELQKRSALQFAVWGNGLKHSKGHVQVVQHLIESGADVNSKDITNTTPLMAAVYVASLGWGTNTESFGEAVVGKLLASRSDMSVKNEYGLGVFDLQPAQNIARLLKQAQPR